MKVILIYDDIKLEEEQGKILKDWITELIKDKESSNTSPLRYIDKGWFSE